MSLVPIKDAFLFVATFPDGRMIFQNEEDRSAKEEGKNCYYDVISDEEKPVSLVITNGELTFGVDLRDGHFEWNGNPFWLHRPELVRVREFEVFWCRIVDQYATMKPGEVPAPAGSHLVGYSIGWRGKDQHSKEVERIFSIYV